MEKNTLAKIREKSNNRVQQEQDKKDNYKSPGGGVILKKFLKDLNHQIIEDYCLANNFTKTKTTEIFECYHKLGYYTPNLSRYLQPEKDFIESNS